MAGLEEKLCPVCFQEAMEHGECRNCGYHAEESSAVKDYLAPFTILKEKYLLGKSLGQGGFGITYLAENISILPSDTLFLQSFCKQCKLVPTCNF